MEAGQFTFGLSDDVVIDIATIDKRQWDNLCRNVTWLMQTKQCDNVGKAYICAFLMYIQEIEMLIPAYDPKKDLSM